MLALRWTPGSARPPQSCRGYRRRPLVECPQPGVLGCSNGSSAATMSNAPQTGNRTRLVFCNQDVDPARVTELLGLVPSEAVRIGEPLRYENGYERASQLGIWRLELSRQSDAEPVEAQPGQWLHLLEPRADGFRELAIEGYEPYLECRADAGSLSICVPAEILGRLSALHLSLSAWVYESPSE